MFRRLLKDRSGATVIEYALIAAAIGLTMAVGFRNLSDSLSTLFSNTATQVQQAGNGDGGG